MSSNSHVNSLILGVSFILGLSALGYLLSDGLMMFKAAERTVTVKGLAEREYPADRVIWPIQFIHADNDLADLYSTLEKHTERIRSFLLQADLDASEISVSAPVITDKLAQQYGGGPQAELRYSALQAVTVYSDKIEGVRVLMRRLGELGKTGIAFTAGDYQNRVEYLFVRLNEVKPEMIQEATTKAREVAMKFAQDSQSGLGKIKQASQGSFSITPRDNNNPHIKKIRVVSTIEYYLSD